MVSVVNVNATRNCGKGAVSCVIKACAYGGYGGAATLLRPTIIVPSPLTHFPLIDGKYVFVPPKYPILAMGPASA